MTLQQKPRIVFVQNRLSDLGGVTTWIKTLGLELAARGYEVEVGGLTRPPAAEDAAAYSGFQKTWALASGTDLPSGGVVAAARKRFAAVADRLTVVVFAQLYAYEKIAAALPAPGTEPLLRTVGQYHGSYAFAASDKTLARIRKRYNSVDLFTCLTEHDAGEFQRAGLHAVVAVDNPIELPQRRLAVDTVAGSAGSAGSGSAADADRGRTVVSLSRFSAEKQVDHMLTAWEVVHAAHPAWRLELYGSGPLQDQICERAAAFGDSVRVCAPVADVAEVLAGAGVLLNSSAFEGLPLSVGEAALLQVPTVAYDCGPGMRELVVDGETGLLAAPGNPGALAAKLEVLLADPGLRARMGAAAAARVRERFSVSRVADTWEAIICNLLR